MTDDPDVEVLAREFHNVYQDEAKRQGDVRHHDDYDDLAENIKEFDRVLARYVLLNFVPRSQAEKERQEHEAWRARIVEEAERDKAEFGATMDAAAGHYGEVIHALEAALRAVKLAVEPLFDNDGNLDCSQNQARRALTRVRDTLDALPPSSGDRPTDEGDDVWPQPLIPDGESEPERCPACKHPSRNVAGVCIGWGCSCSNGWHLRPGHTGEDQDDIEG